MFQSKFCRRKSEVGRKAGGKSSKVRGDRRDNLLLFSVHSMTLHIPQDGCPPRREKEEERNGGTKKKLAVGSRDLVWYPTPPRALLSTHILATPLREIAKERRDCQVGRHGTDRGGKKVAKKVAAKVTRARRCNSYLPCSIVT